MKKNYMAALALSFTMMTGAMAQNTRNCGTMQHLHELEQNDPTLQARIQNIARETEQLIQTNNNNANKAQPVNTIPIRVHVLYNTTSQKHINTPVI